MYKALFKHLEMSVLDVNQVLFSFGDRGEHFFAIIVGEVQICVPRTIQEIENLSSISNEEVSSNV